MFTRTHLHWQTAESSNDDHSKTHITCSVRHLDENLSRAVRSRSGAFESIREHSGEPGYRETPAAARQTKPIGREKPTVAVPVCRSSSLVVRGSGGGGKQKYPREYTGLKYTGERVF